MRMAEQNLRREKFEWAKPADSILLPTFIVSAGLAAERQPRAVNNAQLNDIFFPGVGGPASGRPSTLAKSFTIQPSSLSAPTQCT